MRNQAPAMQAQSAPCLDGVSRALASGTRTWWSGPAAHAPQACATATASASSSNTNAALGARIGAVEVIGVRVFDNMLSPILNGQCSLQNQEPYWGVRCLAEVWGVKHTHQAR